MQKHVFICHSSKDTQIADMICSRLEKHGIVCWIAPRDIPPGETWARAIVDGINQAAAVTLVLSDEANDSPQVLREVERAVNKRIPIIPVRVDDVMPSSGLEYFISTCQWLDAFPRATLDKSIEKLVTTLTNKQEDGQEEVESSSENPSSPTTHWKVSLSIAAMVLLILSFVLIWILSRTTDSEPFNPVEAPMSPGQTELGVASANDTSENDMVDSTQIEGTNESRPGIMQAPSWDSDLLSELLALSADERQSNWSVVVGEFPCGHESQSGISTVSRIIQDRLEGVVKEAEKIKFVGPERLA